MYNALFIRQPMIMQIQLNGENRPLDNDTSLLQLLESLDLIGKRLAIEINGEIIPKSKHASHQLQDGDRVEIVHAIGGGQPQTF